MDCPKCHAPMAEALMERMVEIVVQSVLASGLTRVKRRDLKIWMSELLDSGDVEIGKANDEITDINRPICGKKMKHVKGADQPHIGYEICREHSMYFDAGEFNDFKNHTLWEKMTKFIR